MICLDDARLLDAHLGEATPDDRRHLTACARCTGRLQALARDARRMTAALQSVPPSRRRRAVPGWIWTPAAVAAAVALAIGLARSPDAVDDTSPLALADELTALFAVDATLAADAASEAVTTSTCAWGDSLLQVGCDEPAVMQIAWR